MTRITAELVSSMESAAIEALADYIAVVDYKGAADYCLTAMAPDQAGEAEHYLQRFFLALWFLENAKYHTLASPANIRDVTRVCEILLQSCGINPVASKFSDLYGRLYRSLSQWNMDAGNSWDAMWQANLGQQVNKPDTADVAVSEVMSGADRAYYLGHAASASSSYFYAEENATAVLVKAQARLGRIHCLRLIGETLEAKTLAALAVHEFPEAEETVTEFAWQERLCDAQLTGRIDPVAVAWKQRSPFHQARYVLTSTLWAYAQPQLSPRFKLRKAASIRNRFSDAVFKGTYDFILFRMLCMIEDCHDERIGIVERLKNLGEFIGEARSRWMAADQLVFYAAVMRWLERQKQQQFLAYLLNEYTGLALRVAAGRSSDPLNLVADLLESDGVIHNTRHTAALTELPLTNRKRLLKLSSLASQAGMMFLKNKIRRKDNPTEAASNEQFMVQMAEMIIEHIGTIKGPFMKMGQILVGLKALPEEARRRLQESLAHTRTLEAKHFFAAFKAEHGRYPHEVFKNIRCEPIGVGSMAQVFYAELPDGKPVAVKIIYPELAKQVESDLKVLKLLKPASRYLFPNNNTDELLDKMGRIYLEECDLRIEARNHQKMAAAFAGRDDVMVPHLYQEYTSRSVLVTEFIDGVKVHEFARTASLTERTWFSLKVLEIFCEAISKFGLMQLDPHGGNYLYRDGKVVLLDFGGLLEVGPELREYTATHFAAMLKGDHHALYELFVSAKMFDPAVISEEVCEKHIAPFVMGRYYPGFNHKSHHIFNFFDPFFRGGLREALFTSADTSFLFVTVFLYLTMSYSIFSDDELKAFPREIELWRQQNLRGPATQAVFEPGLLSVPA